MREIENRCETACIRSGFLAIVLSGLGMWLLAPLDTMIPVSAFGKYVTLRASLEYNIEFLRKDPCYLQLAAEGKDPERMPIGNLMTYQCHGTFPVQGKPGQGDVRDYKLQDLYPIYDDMHELANEKLRDTARHVVSDLEWQLVKWHMSWFSMWRQGKVDTLEKISRLSAFQPPDLSRIVELLKPGLVLQTPWSPISFTANRAASFLEIGLFVVLGYFLLFLREAVILENFPTSGSLFAALVRSKFSYGFFLALLSMPAISAVLVAYHSVLAQLYLSEIHSSYSSWVYPVSNVVFAVVVVLLSISARLTFATIKIAPK